MHGIILVSWNLFANLKFRFNHQIPLNLQVFWWKRKRIDSKQSECICTRSPVFLLIIYAGAAIVLEYFRLVNYIILRLNYMLLIYQCHNDMCRHEDYLSSTRNLGNFAFLNTHWTTRFYCTFFIYDYLWVLKLLSYIVQLCMTNQFILGMH